MSGRHRAIVRTVTAGELACATDRDVGVILERGDERGGARPGIGDNERLNQLAHRRPPISRLTALSSRPSSKPLLTISRRPPLRGRVVGRSRSLANSG